VVVALMAMAIVVAVRRWRDRWTFLVVAVLLYPFAYAMSPLSVYSRGGSPRYFLSAMPLVALLCGKGLAWVAERAHPVVAAVGVALALTVSVVGLRDLADHHLGWFPGAPDALVPPTFGDLRTLLDDRDVRFAYADYWVSFRGTFETGERTIIAPVQPYLDRFPPYSAEVAASPHPAFITLRQSQVTAHVQAKLDALGISYRTSTRGEFVLIEPTTNVARETLTPAYQLQE
jgi:hypothetical protein